MKNKKRKTLAVLLAIVIVVGAWVIAPSATEATENFSAYISYEALICFQQLQSHSVEDVRRLIVNGNPIYQEIRVHYDDIGVVTYQEPIAQREIEHFLASLDGNIQPFNINSFPVTRIRYSGLPRAESIVIILLGDRFTLAQYGTWPNPARGTVLYLADIAINTMISTHPFGLFADLFTVYVIHSHGTHPLANGYSYLGAVIPDGRLTPSNTLRQYRIRALADAIVNPNDQDMIQIIANSNRHENRSGFAIGGIAVTSTRNNQNGASTATFPNGTAWQGVFIHEFGHSFGDLADEHFGNANRNERRANVTRATDANLKWRHWHGHRNVCVSAPRRSSDGWAVPTYAARRCLMDSVGHRNFCGVCTAELVRRMALVSGETFHGRRPETDASLPNTPTVVIPPGTNRILDSAFHGNTSLQTIHIPASVNEIGDFAFIGATGLRTIHNASTIPQQINDTTFAGVNRANVSVFIPTGTTQAYIAAGWGRFRLVESGALTVSTWAQLRAAVNAAPANTPTIIHITESFSAPTGAAGEAIIIPANRQITLVSAGANAAQASFSTLGEEFLLPQLSLPVLYDSVESIELSPIIGEDVSLRECEFARHYLHEDGTITTALFAQPVNFLDASGAWQDIDNTLQLQRDGTFTPVASSMDIQIPQDATSGLLTIDRGSYSIAFGSTETARSAMVGQLVAVDEMQAEHTVARSRQEQIELSNDYMMQVENLASAVSFGNVEQIVTNGGVHEQITVYQRQREYTYSYNFLMSGLIPVAQENGSFTLYSEVTSEPKFVLQAPFMFDASGEVNGIDFELRDGTVSLRADAEWINTLERTLPVTIVPMSVQPWREGPIRDTYVNSANSLITNTLINFVGSRETGGINRTLMRFDLSSIPNNRVITSANLQITQNRTYSFSSGMNMQIYRLAAAIPASVNWGNQPNLGGLAATQAIVSASGHSYNISITNTARNWHENSASNHGIAIMSGDESRSTRVDLASSRNLLTNNRPSLIVTHAPPVNAVQTITQARSSQRHFIVNGSLTLGSGITLSGGTATNSNNAGGVQVNAGGNFTMNTGSIIENCRRTIIGGAVALAGSGTAVGTRATFTLAGGTIRNNSATNGGGVNLGANSRMTMSSGYIRNNVTTDAASTGSVGGGGVRINSATATFEMTGGTIENNTSARHGGGVHVATNGAAFTMRGGTIRANTAANHGGGVGMSSSTSNRATLLLAGGTIENNTAVNGGGVGTVNISNSLYGPQLTMTSGVIRNNTATTNGGGVHVAAGATFTMNGASARIENNRSTSTTATNGGGGVNLLGSGTDAATRATFTLQNGTISGNEGRSGGGVRVATNGRMNMTGGTITNNRSTATTATGGGGGVYVSSGTIANGMGFNMTGGTISNNTAVNNGGGIFSTLHSTANPVPTTAYANLRITAAARFSGNRSRQAFAPPSNRLAHIATTASVSFGNYALNNHDINYTGS